MTTLTLIASLCVIALFYLSTYYFKKKKWATRMTTYFVVLLAMLLSLNMEAQINLIATDATCLQNGELSWTAPVNAPANAIVSYTIVDGNGNLTNLDVTMFLTFLHSM